MWATGTERDDVRGRQMPPFGRTLPVRVPRRKPLSCDGRIGERVLQGVGLLRDESGSLPVAPFCPAAFSPPGTSSPDRCFADPGPPYPSAVIIAAIAPRVGTSRIGLRNSGQLDSFTATALWARSM